MISDSQALGALLRTEFALFLRFAFQEVGGDAIYAHNWHVDAIIHQLDRVCKGNSRRLIVTMPPRHLKSVTISTAWVAWMLGKNPALRFICVSYGQDLADKHARDCLRIMQSSWYRDAFPTVVLARRTMSDFETSAGGGRLSTSLGGVLTGRGANIIVIDDPMKADEAMHQPTREAAKEWLHNSLMSRLDSQEQSSIILVMQRLHQDDLAGELIERGGWNELRLSAIATHDERIIDHVRGYAARHGYGNDHYEIQMLYGVRRDLQVKLANKGYKMRVYVPYGKHWYPYFMRRLAERPANIWFVLKNMFKG